MNLPVTVSYTVASVAGDIQHSPLHPSRGGVMADGVVTLGLVELGACGQV